MQNVSDFETHTERIVEMQNKFLILLGKILNLCNLKKNLEHLKHIFYC